MRWPGVLAAVCAVATPGCGGATTAAKRQAGVRPRGQQVMPFDLDHTTHVFAKTAGGGVKSVLIKSAADGDQLPLIRTHLRKEQRLFSHGNFRDPMVTHGMQISGLDTLRRQAALITITYHPLPRGAQLRYSTSNLDVRDAQLMDHGMMRARRSRRGSSRVRAERADVVAVFRANAARARRA